MVRLLWVAGELYSQTQTHFSIPMANQHHFLIGLGGAGGAALKAFRVESFNRRQSSTEYTHKPYNMVFLYIDSCEADIQRATEWESNDSFIGLRRETETIHLRSLRAEDAASLCNRADVASWIGEKGEEYVRSLLQTTPCGAAQRRRYGRLLAAAHSREIHETMRAGLYRLLHCSSRADDEAVFHVFASTGGGTGAGCLVDILTLIPLLGAERGIRCRTVVYLFVGVREYAFLNGYTTLQNLNALMANQYHPCCALLPEPVANPYHDTLSPIDAVYISTDEHGESLHEQAARFGAGCYNLIELNENIKKCELRPFSGGGQESVVRFKTFSTEIARHPVADLRRVLSCTLGVEVVNSWLYGDKLRRRERDVSHYGWSGKSEMHGRERKQDAEFRAARLKEFNQWAARYLREQKPGSPPACILRKTREKCAEIHALTVQDVHSCQNGRSGIEHMCRSTALELRANIIAELEARRKWSPDNRGYIWGIRDIIDCLRNLQEELMKETAAFPDHLNDEVMQLRVKEWEKIGMLTSVLTPIPRRIIHHQLNEGRALIAEQCENRQKALLNVRNRFLAEMLVEDIAYYTMVSEELQRFSENLRNQRYVLLSSLLCPPPGHLLYWREPHLDLHVDEYDKNPQCYDEVRKVLFRLDPEFCQALGITRNWREFPSHPDFRDFDQRMQVLSREARNVFWQESDRIHTNRCESLSSRCFMKEAYHDTIYDYLATESDQYVDEQMERLLSRLQSSAELTDAAYNSPGEEAGAGVLHASFLDMAARMSMHLNPIAQRQYDRIKDHLSSRLERRSSQGCFTPLTESDATEIRISRMECCMPLQAFRVMKPLEECYKKAQAEAGPELLYFANIDNDSMNS